MFPSLGCVNKVETLRGSPLRAFQQVQLYQKVNISGVERRRKRERQDDDDNLHW